MIGNADIYFTYR